jgi:hypothetical protein
MKVTLRAQVQASRTKEEFHEVWEVETPSGELYGYFTTSMFGDIEVFGPGLEHDEPNGPAVQETPAGPVNVGLVLMAIIMFGEMTDVGQTLEITEEKVTEWADQQSYDVRIHAEPDLGNRGSIGGLPIK